MSIFNSLIVGVFGMAVVFVALVALILVIKIITRVLNLLDANKNAEQEKDMPAQSMQQPATAAQASDGVLKLYDVDEKTAALIMAIVSEESKIPLPQLQFKSIRLIK